MAICEDLSIIVHAWVCSVQQALATLDCPTMGLMANNRHSSMFYGYHFASTKHSTLLLSEESGLSSGH
jgi:hypothetical protein